MKHNANNTKQQLNQISDIETAIQNGDTNHQELLRQNIKKQNKIDWLPHPFLLSFLRPPICAMQSYQHHLEVRDLI